ncbi:MAG: membrane protein insertion efficiency factor YidD [Candidatus Omnitrophota bacterium]
MSWGKIALCLIGVYQNYVRVFLPQACRFEPTCSEYARQSIQKYGFIKGATHGLRRILRCHPFSGKAGIDPV